MKAKPKGPIVVSPMDELSDIIQNRKAFTPGWNDSVSGLESLPVKSLDGKVIRSIREESSKKKPVDDTIPVDHHRKNAPNMHEVGEKIKRSFSDIFLAPAKDFDTIRAVIGKICTDIISDPEKAVTKKDRDASADPYPKLSDLLGILKHPSPKVQEVALLSCQLVFKDICPGYRIRTSSEYDKNVIMKKETKKIRDFESALLTSYQRYLKILDEYISVGIDSAINTEMEHWDSPAKVAYVAIQCQCELIKSLLEFNFRSILLYSIINIAACKQIILSSLCSTTLIRILSNDTTGEVTYEIVRMISKTLSSKKYDVPETFLRILENVKLKVHADRAKDVRKQAKKERRKRRREHDDVEVGLLEAASPAGTNLIAQRFQADTLHEICLIYFRYVVMIGIDWL